MSDNAAGNPPYRWFRMIETIPIRVDTAPGGRCVLNAHAVPAGPRLCIEWPTMLTQTAARRIVAAVMGELLESEAASLSDGHDLHQLMMVWPGLRPEDRAAFAVVATKMAEQSSIGGGEDNGDGPSNGSTEGESDGL